MGLIKKFFLLLLFCLTQGQLFAQSQVWTYGQTEDKRARWAMVMNDSGGALSQRCELSTENCYWSIAISTACEKDATFPILGSSDAGSIHINLYCGESFNYEGKPYYQYFFKDFAQIDKLVRDTSSPIGFAMALQSGRFLVIRFEMTNAVNAIDSMRAMIQSDIDKKPKKKTKDQFL